MTRQQANLKIMALLYKAVVDFPDWRFGQLLRNLDIVGEVRDDQGTPTGWRNSFNDESEYTLKQLENGEMGKYLMGIKNDIKRS